MNFFKFIANNLVYMYNSLYYLKAETLVEHSPEYKIEIALKYIFLYLYLYYKT